MIQSKRERQTERVKMVREEDYEEGKKVMMMVVVTVMPMAEEERRRKTITSLANMIIVVLVVVVTIPDIMKREYRTHRKLVFNAQSTEKVISGRREYSIAGHIIITHKKRIQFTTRVKGIGCAPVQCPIEQIKLDITDKRDTDTVTGQLRSRY